MPLSRAAPTPYYPALTGVRAVAAFMVLEFHHRHLHGLGASGAGAALLGELHIGAIFFTLSGYLITARYRGQQFDGPRGGATCCTGWRAPGPYLALVVASLALHYGLEQPAHRWLLARFEGRCLNVVSLPLPTSRG